ncbi:MAG: T9SS type A sorting domain-containing protein [Sphingobacteriales bacterium]|nr:T9SS type A sorting domain-containing protein [Sphingobacteriales bacterium]
MKHFIFYITMLLSCSLLQAQADDYIPMLQAGNVWKEWQLNVNGPGQSWNNYITKKIDGDSLINGKMYRKIIDSMYAFDNLFGDTIVQPFKLRSLLREENRQVIRYNTSNETEYILYDFNLQTGDSISSNSKIINSGDTILADGLSHKYYEIDTFSLGDLYCNSYIQIEGVGSNQGLGVIMCSSFENYNSGYLVCFSRNDSTIYGNCSTPDDTLSVPVLALPPQTVSVSPNPAGQWVELRAAMPLEWRIYDVRGVLRYRSGGAQSYLSLSLQGWQAGVYYYQATDGKEQYSGKFLVGP